MPLELSPVERAALIALMASGGPLRESADLVKLLKIALRPTHRARLQQLGLIATTQGPIRHELTEKGWRWAREEMAAARASSPPPEGQTGMGALYALLAGVGRLIERDGVEPAALFRGQARIASPLPAAPDSKPELGTPTRPPDAQAKPRAEVAAPVARSAPSPEVEDRPEASPETDAASKASPVAARESRAAPGSDEILAENAWRLADAALARALQQTPRLRAALDGLDRDLRRFVGETIDALRHAARAREMEIVGNPGDVAPFDGESHEDDDQGFQSGDRVQIVRPAVFQGSGAYRRVVRKAQVIGADQ